MTGAGAITGAATVVSGGNATYTGGKVCLEDIQSDGNLTLLNMVNTGPTLSSYGFLVDQVFSNGASYTGSSNLTPAPLNWTSTTARNPDFVSMGAVRKGVQYSLGFDTSTVSANAGSFPTANQFPADNFGINAILGLEANTCGTQRRFTTAPTSVDIAFPDYDTTAFTYDAVTGTFAWTVLGNSALDAISISTMFNATPNVEWNLRTQPTETVMVLPDLPPQVQSWFDRGNFVNADAAIIIQNILPLEGFDAVNNALGTGSGVTEFGFDGFDFCSSQLTNLAGGGGTGGGGAGGAVTFSGASASSLPSSAYNPPLGVLFGAGGLNISVTWTDANGTILMFTFDPINASNAGLVSVTTAGGAATWLSTTGPVPGAVVSPNSLTLTNVQLVGSGGALTLNGTLPY